MALKKKYGDKVAFIIVEANDARNAELANTYQIQYIPDIRIINGKGEVVQSYVGYTDEAKIDRDLAAVSQGS